MHAFRSARMSEGFRLISRFLAVAALGSTVAAPAWACNVPVFRYALERWEPDPYYLSVFHADGNAGPVQDLLATLEERPINLYAEAVDVDKLQEDDWRLAGVELDRERLPWAVLRYPPRGGQSPPIAWSGPLDEEVLASLIHSSVRQEVVRRLLSGESAVWVLVESGDREKDQAAREALSRHLAEAKSKLRIPGMDELDYSPTDSDGSSPEPPPLQDPSVAIPLKIEFSLVSISRDNPAEREFLTLLLHSEPDLHEYAGEPMVFPMFGQGRALWALVGAGINAENIAESCIFLTGPCSCQIKSMNPGTDLLMEFDWQGALEGRVPPPPEISPDMLTGVAPLLDQAEEVAPDALAAVTDVGHAGAGETGHGTSAPQSTLGAALPQPAVPAAIAGAPEAGSQERGAPVFLLTGAVLGGLLVVVAVATVLLLGKKKE